MNPTSLTLYAYQVGFGDCFLLRFNYPGDVRRHVLIDFGSMGMPKGVAQGQRLLAIAEDIKAKCAGKLDAVVATHRHADHISGFASNRAGTASGDVIRSLAPELVLQPWTEQLELAEDAIAPEQPGLRGARSMAQTLKSMNALASAVVKLLDQGKHGLSAELARRLGFIGEDNISNASAVNNLASMGKRNAYAFFGSEDALAELLPGVRTHVLGPPTVEQSASIRKQRSRDPAEFWHLHRQLVDAQVNAPDDDPGPFADYPATRGSKLPMSTRWIARRVREARGEQLLQIVTALDKAMNNTSLILLFEVAGKKLLFPGDAQIENWSYALSQPDIRALLADVDLYKVGHHGSLNATPKSLWGGFNKRGKAGTPQRLTSVLSTMPGKHGNPEAGTEVPRRPLLEALGKESELHSTDGLEPGSLYEEIEFSF
ncbi:hypothetical protein HFV04_023455 [Pseudomonas sp. BIGb0427]|uniref:hypothetical protein n=1 Tax=unclassified Pseudomonas TaxID=196821 RepID=UPI0018A70C02|nr:MULTISPECIES: hypothetical protein [unclassified Pseudomonas]QPG62450.1 hypothetical protein HFV04_023455 [Pseudomonas sp. BIGb0427]UVM64794.1 hypothetical protein LOY34_15735 [Pseudomonas sp. B21-009]